MTTPKETDPQWPPRLTIVHRLFKDPEILDQEGFKWTMYIPGKPYEYLPFAESEHLLKKQAEKYEARIAIAVEAFEDIVEYGCGMHAHDPCDKKIASKALAALRAPEAGEGEK